MEDDVGEIECLDEDFDVVQEYVNQSMQLSPPPKAKPSRRKPPLGHRNISKRETLSPPLTDKKKIDYSKRNRRSDSRLLSTNISKNETKQPTPTKRKPPKSLVQERFDSEIIMHDFEDPLCLPVKMMGPNALDRSRLSVWNEKCLKNLFLDNTKTNNIQSSRRVITLKKTKLIDKRTPEISVSTKTTLKHVNGEVKNEEMNAILPQFKEKTLVDFDFVDFEFYDLGRKSTSTVILNKENTGDREKLVVYHLEDGVQAVFDMFDKTKEELEKKNGLGKRILKEVAVFGACAMCYQMSWRPNCDLKVKGNFTCLICQRKFNSVYNYMSHAKLNHKPKEIGAHKMEISNVLSKTINYLYKCRICRKSFRTITNLKNHVDTHKSLIRFNCDIGNHRA